ncbi:MAG: sulfate adenylyltransferase [Promethearchaeota archaeon]
MIEPHGGTLINRIAQGKEKEELIKQAREYHKINIQDRFVSDCEMIAIGGFSPLTGFMDKNTAISVIEKMKLPGGTIWSIPILLPISKSDKSKIKNGDKVILQDKYDRIIAIIQVSEKFTLDLQNYCQKVFKTTEIAHPGVKAVKEAGNYFLAGDINLINRPLRGKINKNYFKDPLQTRKEFKKKEWNSIVAFQTRNPIHRAHEYLIKCALEITDGAFIHPLVGETKPDDVPANIRMQCYETIIENYFNQEKTMLTVLPTAMRYAGPKEAIHHMIMRKNYGCTHMIIGRDHAGVGDYYGTYEAQELVDKVSEQLGIVALKFEHSFYCKKCENMATKKTCPHSANAHVFLSGTKVRKMLKDGEKPPKEFSRPEVVEVLLKWVNKI